MKTIRSKQWPQPIAWVLLQWFLWRIHRGKSAHVTYQGQFYAVSKVHKSLYFLNGHDPVKRWDGTKK